MGRTLPILAAVITLPLHAGERREARESLDAAFMEPVAGQDAGLWLEEVDVSGCLRADRQEVVAFLDGLRGWRATASEDVEERGSRRMLERRLRGASSEGRALVEGWLDARDLARQRWLCEDSLPLPRRGLEAPALVDRAVGFFAGRVRAARPLLLGTDRKRERAVQRLTSLIPRLLGRFDAMFAGQTEQRARLEEVLWGLWEADVEPFWLGWPGGGGSEPDDPELWARGAGGPGSPTFFNDAREFAERHRAPSVERERPPAFFDWDWEPGARVPLDAEGDLEHGVGWMDPGPAGLSDLGGSHNTGNVAGGAFLDPWDQAEVARIAEGWRRQQRQLGREIRAEERRLRALDVADADTARFAERVRRTLRRLRGDERRLAERIRGWRANRPWLTAALATQEKGVALAQAERMERRAERGMAAATELRAAAVAAGGELPAGSSDGTVSVGEQAEVAAVFEGGPPEDESGGPKGHTLGARYEGPLPLPGRWDADLVKWIVRVHPHLDPLDVRLLLELTHRALGDDRAAIEHRFADLLDTRGRLSLRGPEHRLSELHRADQPESGQPEIVFVLELPE